MEYLRRSTASLVKLGIFLRSSGPVITANAACLRWNNYYSVSLERLHLLHLWKPADERCFVVLYRVIPESRCSSKNSVSQGVRLKIHVFIDASLITNHSVASFDASVASILPRLQDESTRTMLDDFVGWSLVAILTIHLVGVHRHECHSRRSFSGPAGSEAFPPTESSSFPLVLSSRCKDEDAVFGIVFKSSIDD